MRPWPWILLAAAAVSHTERRTARPREGTLHSPGDSTTIGGVVITLHKDTRGRFFASAASTTTIKTYGDHMHTHSFEAAARVEDHLEALKTRRRNATTQWSTTIMPGVATAEGTQCDCALAPLADVMVATQPRRARWKFNHEETPLSKDCPLHKNQIYETLMSQPETLRPVCSIVPTRWMRDLLERMRKMKSHNLMREMNDQSPKPCVIEGSYNMRSLPRGRTAIKNATSMIDCALQCLFMTKCSAWTFDQEGPPRCWVINTGYLIPKFNQARGGPYVTGGKECLPCILRRKLEVIAMDGKTDARRLCRLDTNRGWDITAKCACSQHDTITQYDKWIQEAHHEARENTIHRDDPKRRGSLANTLDRILRELRTTHRGLAGLGTALMTPIKPGTKPANWTQALPLVQRFMQMVGPKARVYSKIMPVSALRAVGTQTQPGMKTNRNHTITEYTSENLDPEVDLHRLGAGIHAAGSTIRRTLSETKEFLMASEEWKRQALRVNQGIPGYKELEEDPNIDVPKTANALVITVDTGTEAAQLAVFPHEGTAEARTVSAIPLPTTQGPPGLENPIIRGRWTSPNLYNRERLTEELSEKCALELLTATGSPTHCDATSTPKPRQAYLQVAVDQRGTITRLIRIHTNARPSLPYSINCGPKNYMLDLLGTTLIAIGEACSIKDGSGEQMAFAINPKSPTEQDNTFTILFNRTLQTSSSELNAMDACQLALAAALMVGVAVAVAWKWRAKCAIGDNDAVEEEKAEETELEKIHPEAGTPRDTSTPIQA